MPTNIDRTPHQPPHAAAPEAAKASHAVNPPDPVDLHVGMRLRIRRVLLGLDQRTLGAAVGVSLQQIQKYERGLNRISASRLYDLADALDVPIDYFFRDLSLGQRVEAPAEDAVAELSHAESKALVEAFWDMPDPEFRLRVLDLVDAMAQSRRR